MFLIPNHWKKLKMRSRNQAISFKAQDKPPIVIFKLLKNIRIINIMKLNFNKILYVFFQ